LVTVIVLLIVGVLLIAPIGYHQTITTLRGEIDSHLILISLQSQLIIVSIGVLLLGFILAYSVTHSISVPIRTMIRTFGEVENGDLTQRLKVVSTDEVGKLTIHINYLLAQLEGLQSSLEELRNTQPTHTAESDSATPALNVPLTLHLVEAVATQAALATENARLYNDVSQRADRERIISEITTRIRSTTDPQVMLQTALDELKRALRTDNIRIRPYFPSPADQNPGHKPRPKKNKST
jgi:methyl-accepting chemotaxis protein